MFCRDFFYQPFDIKTHKENAHFLDGFEVMISPDGIIEYAMPSHQEFLIKKGMERTGLSKEDFENQCPKEYYGNYMEWLIKQSGGYIPVWETMYLSYKSLTTSQRNALKKLKINGLYKGRIL